MTYRYIPHLADCLNGPSEHRPVLSIAHRGCAQQAPENTVAAVRQAAPHVDAVEVDVTRCGSGELVLFHDDDLERVTGEPGRVGEVAWDRLADLTVHGSGEPIPRFESVVESWPSGTVMNLDVHDPGIAPEALEACSPLDERIVLSSTSTDVLQEVSPSGSVGLGYSFFSDPDANLETAVAHGCEYVHVAAELAMQSDVIRRAHARDLRVDVWTVDSRPTLRRLVERGADAVTVDRWDILE